MLSGYNSKWDRMLKTLVTTIGYVLTGLSAISLAGWVSGNRLLISIKAEFVPIAPATALIFMIFGLILLTAKLKENKPAGILSLMALLFVASYSILIIAGYILNRDLALENVLFPIVERVGKFPARHVSPYTAFLMIICSLSLFILIRGTRDQFTMNITGFTGLMIAFIGGVSVIGYIYGTPFLYSGNIIPMAAQTAFSFILTGSAILFLSGEDNFFLRHLTANSPYSHLLRIFIPFALGVFILQGVLEVTLTRYTGISQAAVLVLMSLFSISVGIPLIIYITQTIFKNATLAEKERHRIVSELRKNSAVQSLILENTPVGLCMLKNDRIYWTNNEFREILSLTENNCIDKTIREILVPLTDTVQEELLELLTKPETKIDKTILLNLKKGSIWCRFLGSSLESSDSGQTFVFLIEDITDRKKQREMMRLLSHTLSSLSECVSITDINNRIIFVNKAFEITYGFSFEELAGKNISLVSTEARDPENSASILESTKSGGWSGEIINRKKDGTEFHIFLSTSVVTDEKGETVALVGVANDITEKKEAERKIREYNQKLNESNDAKDKLLTIISHDLKSPFSGIMGLVDILHNQADTLNEDEKRAFIYEIKKTTENTFHLLENLLTWARAQRGGISIAPVDFSLSEVADRQIEILADAAHLKEITLRNLINDSIIVHADNDMIKTIILNLLNNAIKFTQHGGEIVIDTKTDGRMAEVSVKDNGVGIKADTLERIFRIDHSKSIPGTDNEKGTGLGLLICKEFAEMNGGRIWVESTPGKGSTFSFTIPLAG